ncbi:MAG: nicotinate (nicotinamide) nucleotide adenylyltransferase [Clostridia bacterium]|nr:nicotinate (nicotinamide) nucleotide adenylyltransferase [Clostridia bacterium]
MGHFQAAQAFLEAEKPDRLLIVPASIPPHKTLEDGVDAQMRAQMCRLCFSALPNTEISDLELRREGRSYTYLTLRELWKEGRVLLLLCGTDMFLTLDEWYLPSEIFARAEIVCMRREEDAEIFPLIQAKRKQYEKEFSATVRFLDADPVVVSSTEIRERIKRNESTAGLLSKEVREYIDQWNLYR